MLMLLNPHRFAPPPFPVVESVIGQSFSFDATNFNVTLPATNAGDLLWLHLTMLHSGTITGPAGWNNLREPSVVNIFSGKVADGTEGGTSVSISTSGSPTTAAAQVIRVSGWSGNLADIENAAVSQSLDPPNLEPSWGAGNTLWIGAYWAQFQIASLVAYPSDTENQNYQNDGSGGSRCELACATRKLNAASWDPTAFVLSGGQDFGAAYTFAIKGAA
jgi:hypothetical protein